MNERIIVMLEELAERMVILTRKVEELTKKVTNGGGTTDGE